MNSNRTKFFPLLLLFVNLFILAYLYACSNEPKLKWIKHTGPGYELRYPETMTISPLTPIDQKANILFRTTGSMPKCLFSIRTESGLGVLRIMGGGILESLISNFNRQYPLRFPDFHKEKFEELILANEKAANFEFTYTGTDGHTRMRQRFTIILNDTTAYYLSAQSSDQDFAQIADKIEQMIQSFKFTK